MERIADVEKVLMNEIDNLHGVYLYLEGDSWCAYERSAYYLAKLNVPVILQKEVIREGYDVVLLKALFAVDDMCLPLEKMSWKRLLLMFWEHCAESCRYKSISDDWWDISPTVVSFHENYVYAKW